jgi:glycosyltransferase involved in cell wall biosynthesis
MSQLISVITCTHNPRLDYLKRVLEALRSQTLEMKSWEFLLIDNASDRLLASDIDLSWHPNAQHIREEQLGLTPARLRGIREAAGAVLIFVDDDNVLDENYLEVTLHISKDWTRIGAWGGQIVGGFEQPPPEWTKPYWKYLGIREFKQDRWSNLLHQHDTTPCGSGMCVRKAVADYYAQLVQNDPQRIALDRTGKSMSSCGDTDLAFTACDMGMGTGQFVALKLTHLIPETRLREDYLLRLAEGIYYSHVILDSFRGKMPQSKSWISRLIEPIRQWKMEPKQRRFYDACKRGADRALLELSHSHDVSL